MSHFQKVVHNEYHCKINDEIINEVGVFILSDLSASLSTQLGAVIPAKIAGEIYEFFSSQGAVVDSELHAKYLIEKRWNVMFSDVSGEGKLPRLTTADGVYFCGDNFVFCEFSRCGKWLESLSDDLHSASIQCNQLDNSKSFMICFVY